MELAPRKQPSPIHDGTLFQKIKPHHRVTLTIRERVKIIINDFTPRSNISITPDGNTFHRVDGTPAHTDPFIDNDLSSIFCYYNATLRQPKHIAEWMGENVHTPHCQKGYLTLSWRIPS